jgi:soluble lytic murein transglycosylase-like protein
MRQAEEAERVARQNQLKIEEQNRANEERSRMAQFQAGLKVPAMPTFDPASGGQPFVSSLNIPAPVAPPASGAQASAVNMNVPQAQPIAPAQYPYYPEEVPPGPAPAASPAGRYLQEQQTAAQERNELSSLRSQVRKEYGLRSGVGGFFVDQTDEERAFAKDVMDRLNKLTKPEIEQLLQTGQLPPETAPKAGVKEPATATIAKQPKTKDVVAQAASYDNTQTPYDTLMSQAAQQYGIDPVVFRRLIGTESSFDPNAVSPRGESFGLGIGQIAEVHGLTREQRLDPNTSIPKAAEIFAGYLREAGGDYNEAIMRYKGASSEKGRAAMQGPANIILNGTGFDLAGKTPAATADNIAKAASAAAPATAGVMYGPSAVAGGAQNPGVQSAMMLRQMMAERYRIASEVGNPDSAMEALTQIAAIDLGLFKAQGEQGVYELATMGDPSRAMSVLSQFTGIPTQALSRGDGTFDIYQNGRVTQTAVPVDKLADLIKTQVDAGYRQQKAELVSEAAADRRKAEIEFGKIALTGNYNLAAEQIKKKTGAQVSNLGDGRAIITYPDGRMAYFDGASVVPTETEQGAISTGVRPTPITQ